MTKNEKLICDLILKIEFAAIDAWAQLAKLETLKALPELKLNWQKIVKL